MVSIVVQYPGIRGVRVDGKLEGDTNRVIELPAGKHEIRLDGEPDYTPDRAEVQIGGARESKPVFVSFRPVAPQVDRFSPLYCRYNGLLLGQFLCLMHARYARDLYAERRDRVREFLKEIDVDCNVPDEPLEVFSNAHTQWTTELILGAARQSRAMGEFALLGMNLILYGHLVAQKDATADLIKGEIERLCKKHGLPPPQYEALVPEETPDGIYLIDPVLTASLDYLAQAVDGVEVEPDTAFVIMPFSPPYADYFGTFYRPALEQAGLRAFRAWGGLSQEDYCGLLLKLIQKSGMVWADISEPNQNVFYEVGAAHAFGRMALLVRSEARERGVPANIGHDSVIRYDPDAGDFPREAIVNTAMMIHALRLAAERDERLRIGPDSLLSAVEHALGLLREIIIPREARQAYDEALRLLDSGDHDAAERTITRGIDLGADEPRNYLLRGLIRARRGQSESAIEDFDAAERGGEDSFPLFQTRGITRYMMGDNARAEADFDAAITHDADSADARLYRGLARVLLGNFAGAVEDFGAAAERGCDSSSLHSNRAYALVRLDRIPEALEAVERAERLDPGDPYARSARAAVCLASGQPDRAAAELEAALAREDAPGLHLEMVVVLLCLGRPEKARRHLEAALAKACRGELDVALRDLEFWRDRMASGSTAAAEEMTGRIRFRRDGLAG